MYRYIAQTLCIHVSLLRNKEKNRWVRVLFTFRTPAPSAAAPQTRRGIDERKRETSARVAPARGWTRRHTHTHGGDGPVSLARPIGAFCLSAARARVSSSERSSALFSARAVHETRADTKIERWIERDGECGERRRRRGRKGCVLPTIYLGARRSGGMVMMMMIGAIGAARYGKSSALIGECLGVGKLGTAGRKRVL